MYQPNKFVDGSAEITSPRSFRNNPKLEEEVQGNDFALGHLLNLLKLRIAADASGVAMQDEIVQGNYTSNLGLEHWVKMWHDGCSR